MNPVLLQRLVDYFLHTYTKVEDPRGALIHALDGDILLAERFLSAWRKVAETDSARWMLMLIPNPGDQQLRAWIIETYLAN